MRIPSSLPVLRWFRFAPGRGGSFHPARVALLMGAERSWPDSERGRRDHDPFGHVRPFRDQATAIFRQPFHIREDVVAFNPIRTIGSRCLNDDGENAGKAQSFDNGQSNALIEGTDSCKNVQNSDR